MQKAGDIFLSQYSSKDITAILAPLEEHNLHAFLRRAQLRGNDRIQIVRIDVGELRRENLVPALDLARQFFGGFYFILSLHGW